MTSCRFVLHRLVSLLGNICKNFVSCPIMYGVSQLFIWVVPCLIREMFQVFQLTAFVVHGPATRGKKFPISLDRLPTQTKGRVVSCSVCKVSFRAQISRRGASFQNRARQCSPNKRPLLTTSHQAPYMLRGAMWKQCGHAKLWPICVLAGTGLTCASVLQNIPVSDSIMVAPHIVRHHRGDRWGFSTSWKRDASKTCQLFFWLLVLLCPAIFVLPRQAQEENFSELPETAPQI